jgi:hypothetical protein
MHREKPNCTVAVILPHAAGGRYLHCTDLPSNILTNKSQPSLTAVCDFTLVVQQKM